MKIGLIVAMDSEYRNVKEALGGVAEGCFPGSDNLIVLQQCGVGKVNAAIGTTELIANHHPDCIISTGLAGGIDASLRVMEVVVGTQMVYHDVDCGSNYERGQVMGMPTRYDADPALLRQALSLDGSDGLRVRGGLMCTGDQFITSREGQAAIKRNFPEGLACEMESTAIAQVCYLRKVPFLAVRVISDTPGNTDNHQAQWDTFLANMTDRSFAFVKNLIKNL